jgi:adenosine deaminase
MSFTEIEKADLHVHLNGAVPSEVMARLAKKHEVPIAEDFDIHRDLTMRGPVKGLEEYLKPWLVFKKLPTGRACLNVMVDTAFQAFAEDHVNYVEARNSPFNIPEINSVSLADSLWWLVESFQCYGRKHSIEAKLVLSLDKAHRSDTHAEALISAIKSVHHSNTIVGLDISGGEDGGIDSRIARLFKAAKEELGLGITVHAGEEGSTEMVGWAIKDCEADRIGHGLALAKSEELMNAAIEHEICVEVCLSTNYLSGQVSDIGAHPVKEFIARGIPFVLCSDNPAVNRSSLSREYRIFKAHLGNEQILYQMKERARRYRFAGQHKLEDKSDVKTQIPIQK